ncbi:uncharacterized protein [Argopecten irradians]|uniref:uncharacterized protein n=1 Tax=Argopecten irradians TaxID=31199 RepID=UPI0037112F1E
MRKKKSDWIKSRNSIAKFLNADPDDVVLLPNVTTGIVTILMSIPFKPGDTILITNLAFQSTYNACVHILHYFSGVAIKTIRITIPIHSTTQVVNLFREALDKDPNIRAVVIDYITCEYALQLPVEEILDVCQQYTVFTIIDGAHAPGQLSLYLDKMKAEFFTGNFYKWMFAPWGCAFVWKNKKVSFPLKSLTSSSPKNDILSQFYDQSCRNESCYYSLPTAVHYIRSKGGIERISMYNTRLLQMASEYLVRLWQTSTLDVPSSMEPPFIRMIRLPKINGFNTSEDDIQSLMDLIYHDHHIDVCLKSVNDQLYVRLSVHIYNCLDDYKKLGNAVLLLMEKRRNGNHACSLSK